MRELTDMKHKMCKLGWRAHRTANPRDPVHEEYWTKQNAYADAIDWTKWEHWQEWLEGVDEDSVWTAHRFLSSPSTDRGHTRIPTLCKKGDAGGNITYAESNEDKGQLLFDSFYSAHTLDHGIGDNAVYPPPKFNFSLITDTQIIRAISCLHAYKAPGVDNIPNAIFVKYSTTFIPYLGHLYRATFALGV